LFLFLLRKVFVMKNVIKVDGRKVRAKKLAKLKADGMSHAQAIAYLKNGAVETITTLPLEPRPDDVIALAESKRQQLEGKIAKAKQDLEALESELESWGQIANAFEKAEA
jgi:hypothetical protein